MEKLIASAHKNQFSFTLSELKTVVDRSGKLIRANRGHSIAIDLHLPPQQPPSILDHDIPEKYLASIVQKGLHKMKRHHVHRSSDRSYSN